MITTSIAAFALLWAQSSQKSPMPLVLVTSSPERLKTLEKLLNESPSKDQFTRALIHVVELENALAYIDGECITSKIESDFELLVRLIELSPGATAVNLDELDAITRRAVAKIFLRSPMQGRVGAMRTMGSGAIFAYRPFVEMDCKFNDEIVTILFDQRGQLRNAVYKSQLGPEEVSKLEANPKYKGEVDQLEKEVVTPSTTFVFRGLSVDIDEELTLIEKVTKEMRKLVAKTKLSRAELEQRTLSKYLLTLGVKSWPLQQNTRFSDLPEAFQQGLQSAFVSRAGVGANKAALFSFLQKTTVKVRNSGYLIETGYVDAARDTGHIFSNSLASIRF